MKKTIGVLTIVALFLSTPAIAGDEEKVLTIGDAAPAIDVAHWVKGEEVTKFEKDQIYVVEFWATWCGPCRSGMPHLSELQEKHAEDGVTIIGVSNETLPKVMQFARDNMDNAELQAALQKFSQMASQM